MKNYTIILFITSLFFATPSWSQENKLEEKFIETVEQTRDRIMTMHGEGELATVQYEEERAVVRQAEQIEQLLEEGKEVDKKTLTEWISKLNRLGRVQSKEGEGVQYREKPWPSTQMELDKKIEAQRKKLDEKYEGGEIDKKSYTRSKEQLETMKTELKELNSKMNKLQEEIQALEGRVDQFEKDMK